LYVQYCLGNNTSTNTDQITITNITRDHSFDNVHVNQSQISKKPQLKEINKLI